ncbi:acyl-CoA N-acyltransferase [Obba rivulosa]|uniref:Acyl-CoA N-acyltransferase n=1 Tax=Obba rivulosa TaxID=1052685 RepID=A0A8E2J3L0_9APHY|nr:acyl-CoA N-acyltransferase [Obba rivulosa]
MSSSTPTGLYIRTATAADSPALSHICLLTADAGVSAAPLHNFGELPGLIWAEPYAQLPSGFGFVLADPSQEGAPVGYVLGTADTRAFERDAGARWYPRLRETYPAEPAQGPGAAGRTEADARCVRLLHAPPRAHDAAVAFSPAHMHIDLLPACQRQGWGRRLVACVVQHLRDEHGLDALWLGLDPRNVGARAFYERLGFRPLEGAPEGTMGLKFADFKG